MVKEVMNGEETFHYMLVCNFWSVDGANILSFENNKLGKDLGEISNWCTELYCLTIRILSSFQIHIFIFYTYILYMFLKVSKLPKAKTCPFSISAPEHEGLGSHNLVLWVEVSLTPKENIAVLTTRDFQSCLKTPFLLPNSVHNTYLSPPHTTSLSLPYPGSSLEPREVGESQEDVDLDTGLQFF